MAKVGEFRRCLEEQKLPSELIQWCESVLGIETLSDFVNIVTINGYEEELNTTIIAVCDHTKNASNKVLLLARLRAAWRQARAAMLRAEVKLQQGQSVDDLDDPLDSSTQESLMETWKKRYNLELSVHMSPSDSLLGRVWREIQRGTLTVIAIDKVKSLFAVNKPKNDRFIDLGAAKLQLRHDDDSRVAQSVAEYYQRLRVLMNAYSVAGAFSVESKITAGAKVLMAPLAVLLNYCDATLRHATDFQAGVDWVKYRDEQCRARVVELSRQQWPIGEAFEKAYQEQELMWLQPPSRKRNEQEIIPTPESQESGSAKKPRTGREYRAKLCARGGMITGVAPSRTAQIIMVAMC